MVDVKFDVLEIQSLICCLKLISEKLQDENNFTELSEKFVHGLIEKLEDSMPE